MDRRSEIRRIVEEVISERNLNTGNRPVSCESRPSQGSSRPTTSQTQLDTQNVTGVVRRARDLLRSNATSVSSNVSSQLPKRRRVNHSYVKEPRKKYSEQKTFELICLNHVSQLVEEESLQSDSIIPDYSISKDDVLFSGTVDVMTDDNEQLIREKICKVISVRLPNVTELDFDFVKVSRKTVSTPVCSNDQCWDYTRVKVIAGQGKLYVRLNQSVDLLRRAFSAKQDSPADSSGSSRSNLEQLCQMFPRKPRSEIEEALSNNLDNIQDAIADLLDDDVELVEGLSTTIPESEGSTRVSAHQDEEVTDLTILQLLKNKVTKDAKKVKIDPDDLLSDALQVYKHPNFDPAHPFIIQYKQQPAVDTGGVLREFYSDVFKEFVNNPSVCIFEGPPDKLQFYYNHTALTCGMPKMLGTMVAHSLCQNGPGFPYFAPSQYYYIATGDINKAIAYASIHDVHDYEIKVSIEQIMTLTKPGLDTMNQSKEFQSLIQNCGMHCQVTEENKLTVIQAIIGHCAVVKKVPMLEQFINGLKTLGVIDVIRRYPDHFLQHFVQCAKNKTPAHLKELLKLKKTGNDENCLKVFNMLLQFVEECSEEDIDKFMKFSTGCSDVLPSPTENIFVEVSPDAASIFASTCLFKLVFPLRLSQESYEFFNAAVSAVISTSKKEKSFCVP